jgi:hypothetical protein
MDVPDGRSTGVVVPPLVDCPVPPLSDEEIQQSLEEVGITGLKIGKIKHVRKLGQAAAELGAISLGRGFLMCGVGELLEISKRAGQLEEAEPSWEAKTALLRIRRDCASGVTKAAGMLLELEKAKGSAPDPKIANRLPEFGEELGPTLTQINAQEVTIHSHG